MQLKEVSYYQTGGTCDQWIVPGSVPELAKAMSRLHAEQTPYFLLGAGSNSLVMDDHWPGAVVMFSRLKGICTVHDRIIVEAGVLNTFLAEKCLADSLTGAEWMYCLPGQVGATVRMNARCYGGEISQIVESVTVVTRQGQIRKYPNDGIFLGYKDTIFMSSQEVVASVTLKLKPGEQDEIRRQMVFCKTDREKKHQLAYPSCGCVFKNDYTAGVPSGLLLDKVGVRAFSTGQVEISPYHANFVFNKGASARQILEVTLNMREAVYQHFGIWLAYEMEILGQLPEDLKKRISEVRKPQPNESEIAPLREHFLAGQ
ncbi:MAG: UDP-N-acetylmuramate dehydrogenase [bacterium]